MRANRIRGTLALGMAMGRPVLMLALVVAVMLLLAVLARPAHAAGFTVNSTGDRVDANPGNGSCSTGILILDPGGIRTVQECTLRAAVQESNALAGADTIGFAVDTVTLSRTGADDTAAAGDLDITQDVTINGGGVVASAAPDGATFNDRAFDVHSPATANISNVTVRGFVTGEDGGGMRVSLGAGLALRDSTFEDNQAQEGGGISSSGSLDIVGSTFASNTAGRGGGLAVFVSDTATISNSTFSGNDASDGGGIAHYGAVSVPLALTNVTIANNASGSAGGIVVPVFVGDPIQVQAKNTIIANNTQTTGGQCAGGRVLNSQGGNLEFPADVTCPFEVQADPRLGPLADNGGPTMTRALLPGSAAVDATAACPPPITDQRGINRPQDGDGNGSQICDIGAFEREVATPPPPATNRAPVARNDSYRGAEDRPLKVPARGVLRNDSDADRDALSASLVSRPGKGRLTLTSNGAFTYKPARNFNGTVRFVYRASDGRGGTDTATATLRIKARPK